jgi:hypothetical protein
VNRARIVRGIQLIVLITLVVMTYITYTSLPPDRSQLYAALANVRPGWLLVAAICALQEGLFGGLRIFALGRVLSKELKVRTAIISEFVLMFCAGVTPMQAGAAPSQVAVLVNGGMRLVDVATAELLTASCTILFFLLMAATIGTLQATGHFLVPDGPLAMLLTTSLLVFGAGFLALFLSATYPPLLKGVIRATARLTGPLGRATLRFLSRFFRLPAFAQRWLDRPGMIKNGLLVSVDDFNHGVRIYWKRGKLAYLSAFLLTFGFFCSRFAVPFFILLGLGLSTTPTPEITIGPPLVQIILTQAFLNFALYLSPTPSGSGIAEVGSKRLMESWVRAPFDIPYLVLWRLLAQFLCMVVGGIYVFRYLGTDVLEERAKAVEAEKKALDASKAMNLSDAPPPGDPVDVVIPTGAASGPVIPREHAKD